MKTPLPITEQFAFWQLPIASVGDLARVLGLSPQALAKIDVPVIRLGGQRYDRPVEIAHSIRAIKAEVSA